MAPSHNVRVSYFRSARVITIIVLVVALVSSLVKIHSLTQARDVGAGAGVRLSDSEITEGYKVVEGKQGMLPVAAYAAAAVEAGKLVSVVSKSVVVPPSSLSKKKKTKKKKALRSGGNVVAKNLVRLFGAPNLFATAASPLSAVPRGGGTAVPAFIGDFVPAKYQLPVSNLSFPLIKLTGKEEMWFSHLDATNLNLLLSPMPCNTSPLDTLPYPPGVPTLASYNAASKSATYFEMEMFSNAFLTVNSLVTALYRSSRDPLHSWSRKYEYVWAAEALRAMLPASARKALIGTWPRAAAKEKVDFYVVDAASGFTFFPQFLESRLGVKVIALDTDESYVSLFGGTASRLLDADVPTIPFIVASIEKMGLPTGSIDAIIIVSVIDTFEPLIVAINEFKRVLKRGGRLLLSFNTGEPRIAKDSAQTRAILTLLRAELIEDTSHGASPKLIAGVNRDTQKLFHNGKTNPREFEEVMISISVHVFINP